MKKIDPDKFYTVKEVLGLGILTASNLDTKRQMLLRHIRDKKIDAKNLGGEKKPRYLIQGSHLIAYSDRQMKPESYAKG